MGRTVLFCRLEQLLKAARSLNETPGMSWEELESRREFMKRAAQLSLAALPATQFLTACSHPGMQRYPAMGGTLKSSDDPVIIVGGGIAGLTAAFYLTRSKIACEIHEASPRIGGRMFTQKRFNSDGMTCELGGELVDSNHQDLMGLCKFFKIPLDDFAPGDQGLAQNLYYFPDSRPSSGMRYYTDLDAVKMLQAFDKKFKGDFNKASTDDGAKVFDQQTLQQYLDSCKGEVDAWFLEMLRVAYVGECGLEAEEQSALNLVTTLSPETDKGFKLYGESDQAKRIRGGNQALIGALEDYLKTNQVPFHMASPLVALGEAGSRLELTFGLGGKKKTVRASRVICTVPFSVLRKVDGVFALPLSDLKKKCIKELGYGTNGKLMLGFHDRRWRNGATQKSPASNGMVYTSLFVQNIWETSRAQPGNSGILTTFLGGRDGARVSLHDRDKSLGAINEIFPGTTQIHDGHASSFNWTRDPFHLGSYACLLPTQATEFENVSSQPELGGKLLFAGEHATPKFGGFMEGACLSGKTAAQAIIAGT